MQAIDFNGPTGGEKLVVPSGAETRELIRILRDEQTLREVQEQAQLARDGHHGLKRTLPLRDGKEDVARFECFIPKQFYWSRRAKYGRGLFTTDAGQKDLRRHHPEFFTETVSGKITSGYVSKTPVKRRVKFGPGTLALAK